MNRPTSGERRTVIVFVHGFASGPECWDQLVTLLQEDSEVTERFEIRRFPQYPSPWLNIRPDERIPAVKEIADTFRGYLDSEDLWGRELVLVGHSQGGLVIHSYLAQMLDGQAQQLANIRQIITFATPHFGAAFAGRLRRLLSWFAKNPQEEQLRPLAQETAEAIRKVDNRIASTSMADANHWPIPVFCFGGNEDNIVPPPSPQGPFDSESFLTISGNHSEIIRPPHRKDGRYKEFVEVLLSPVGHPNVFEVEHYETTIKVSPVERKSYPVDLGGGDKLEIETDNICELTRTVRFARSNRCRSMFMIRYSAYAGSCCAEPKGSPENEAGQLRGEFKRSGGKDVNFRFTPKLKSPEPYWLALRIYNGFGEGRRDLHFHLDKTSSLERTYYRRITYTLDLSAYAAAGRIVNAASAYLHPNVFQEECGKRCAELRTNGQEEEPTMTNHEKSIWTWEFFNVRDGTFDLFWDIEE